MDIKRLIRELKSVDVPYAMRKVFLETENKRIDFTGISFDDNNDVLLYVAVGDKEV